MDTAVGDVCYEIFCNGRTDSRLACALVVRYLHARGIRCISTPWFPAMGKFDNRVVAYNAIFINRFIPPSFIDEIEKRYEKITVFETRVAFFDDCAVLRDRPKWDVVSGKNVCSAALVAKHFPCTGDVERFALALEMADKYDRADMTDGVVAWMLASKSIWLKMRDDFFIGGDRFADYANKFAGATVDSMFEIGGLSLNRLKTMYRLQRPFLLRLVEPCAEWDGTAIAMMHNSLLRPSNVVRHWMLADHPGARVALTIKIDQDDDGNIVYIASASSRTIDIANFVPNVVGFPGNRCCNLTQAQMDTGKWIDA